MRNYRPFLALVVFSSVWFFPLNSVAAAVLRGSVVEVLDGGTITVNVDSRPIKVRLCTVKPPPKGDALAEIVASHLATLIKWKQVAIEYSGLDQDGSIAGIVTLNDADVGMQMVRDGAAMYNRAYENLLSEQSRRLYEESEQAARREARGVWQQVAPPLAKQGGESASGESPKAAESSRDEARRLNDEAYALIQQGNYMAALPKCREAIRLDRNLAEAHKNLALIFCDLGRYADALPECREAIRLAPDLDKAHNVLGKILFGMRDYEGSVQAYQQAVRLNPQYAKAHYNLGVSLMEMGQFKKALGAYQEADALAPNQPIVQLNIGWVLYKLGSRTEARRTWRKVLTMGDPATALRAEQNLSRLP
ncbi:MAG TPA: tetratricopeptide repeat protein [Pyrinomonadaceae bacterium]